MAAWTPERDARLMALHRQGTDSAVIAAEMGRTVGAIDTRLHRLRSRLGLADRRTAEHRPLRPGEIPCLCCRQPFRSAGKHNRLCSPCKQRGGSMSVFDAPAGNGCRNVVYGG